MTGKELILAALSMQPTPRVPWVPFVGSHGGSLLGMRADEYLKSADAMAKGILTACKRYKADGIPVLFDLQLEAEILGCRLHWAENGPPSVKSHPLEDGQTLADLPEFETDAGRLPLVWKTMAKVTPEIGGTVALYGLICGPFTLALHLMGNDIFTEMYDHSDYVQAVIGYCASVGRKLSRAYLDHGADIIAITDPMVSQISPEHYIQFVRPHVDSISREVVLAGGKSCNFVCGDATRNLEVMGGSLADGVSIDENINLRLARDIMSAAGKSLGGNMRLTVVLLLGTQDDARVDTIRCLKEGAGVGYILSPGCDLPYATPPANLEAVAEIVHDPYKRQIAEQLAIAAAAKDSDEAFKAIKLPEYAKEKEVHIDLITLDSATCAPCQYMLDAAQRAAAAANVPFIMKEHKITTPAGIAMMQRLEVPNLPSIVLDGKLVFCSIIPDQAKLVEAIHAAAKAKKP